MEFIAPEIEAYVENHTSPEANYLEELNRETNQKVLIPRMLSGHLQGRVLSMLSKLQRPTNILEIGTYTGYSALCLAEGLQDSGILHTIDINEELEPMSRKYFDKSPYGHQIIQHIGNALDIIPTFSVKWDIVFIDADKSNYINYYKLVIENMNSGGLIICDNVLWSGKVLLEDDKLDEDTLALKRLNQLILNDTRVENVLLPVRDGLLLNRTVELREL
jgi:predicted O-methyltransferase YrrM